MSKTARTYRIMRTGRSAPQISRTTESGVGIQLWQRHGHLYDLEPADVEEIEQSPADWPNISLVCVDARGPYVAPAAPETKPCPMVASEPPKATASDSGGKKSGKGSKRN